MLLDRFREAKAEEIALLMDMASRRELPRPWKGRRPDFLKAIAETAGRPAGGGHCGVQAILSVARRHRLRVETGGSG